MLASSRIDDQYVSYSRVRVSKPATHKIDVAALSVGLDASSHLFYEDRVSDWLDETQYESSLSAITRHPKFSELLAMGDYAVRFTLQKIDRGDVRLHWFPLLKRIANEDPVPTEDRGDADRMALHWLRWGRERGKA
jgi:hypothetical protein